MGNRAKVHNWSSDKVFVYRNLHRKGVVYSLRSQSTGRVVGYSSDINLEDVRFRVGKAGQERVRREGKKYVHAGVVGRPHSLDTSFCIALPLDEKWVKVSYNPYKNDSFVRCDTGEAVFSAIKVRITQDGVFAVL